MRNSAIGDGVTEGAGLGAPASCRSPFVPVRRMVVGIRLGPGYERPRYPNETGTGKMPALPGDVFQAAPTVTPSLRHPVTPSLRHPSPPRWRGAGGEAPRVQSCVQQLLTRR